MGENDMQGEELYIVYMYIVITGSTDEFLAIKFNLINETISLFRDVFFFFCDIIYRIA